MNYIVGVDIGGTFTDCVVVDDEGTITVGKALSTPQDFSVGAVDAVHRQENSILPQPSDGLILEIGRKGRHQALRSRRGQAWGATQIHTLV